MLLSHKHSPTDEDEQERIKKLGGVVIYGRLFGSLAVSRSLGDKVGRLRLVLVPATPSHQASL